MITMVTFNDKALFNLIAADYDSIIVESYEGATFIIAKRNRSTTLYPMHMIARITAEEEE